MKVAVAVIAICAMLTLACTGGGTNSGTGEAAVIKIDGSSTVFPVTEAVAEEFQREKRGKVNVTVGISGTAAASRNLCAAKSMSPTRLAHSHRRDGPGESERH